MTRRLTFVRGTKGIYPLGCQSQQIIQSSKILAEKSEIVKKLESFAGSRGIIRFLSPTVADITKAPFEMDISDGADALGISLQTWITRTVTRFQICQII